MIQYQKTLFLVCLALIALLFVVDMATGAVFLSPEEVVKAIFGKARDEATNAIVCDIRLLKALVAMLVGVCLSVSGLEMQTLFRNPLAGPYILGISSGASLGVALFVLGGSALGLSTGALSSFGIAGAAFLGAASVTWVILLLSRRIRDIMVILILGMMFSSGVSAVVMILQYVSREESLKNFVIWTMGSLGDVTRLQFFVLLGAAVVGLLLAVLAVKPLNLLLLGEQYARTMGLNVRSSRLLILSSTILLAGSVTAFCGPIGFIGLAMPHVGRTLFRSADHRIVMPAAALVGIIAMLSCDILAKQCALPINAITSLIGIPVVVWVVLKNKNMTV